jgi:putative membrane protein
MSLRSTDTLANERTFLAYLRTALAFIAFGFVIARFALFEREISFVMHVTLPGKQTSAVFGIMMAISGVAVGVYGALRYVLTDRAIRREQISAMPGWAAAAGAAIIGLIGLAVAVDLYRFK